MARRAFAQLCIVHQLHPPGWEDLSFGHLHPYHFPPGQLQHILHGATLENDWEASVAQNLSHGTSEKVYVTPLHALGACLLPGAIQTVRDDL